MELRYWEVKAYTPYCGEEMTEYCISTDGDKPTAFADALMEDCAAEWGPDFETCYEDYGYDSPEEYEEAYYADCGVEYRELTKEDYEFYTRGYYHG